MYGLQSAACYDPAVNKFGQTTRVSGFEFKTVATADVSSDELALIHQMFDDCYRQPNHEHLEKSLKVLRFVSFASRDGKPAAFAMADSLVIDLPRLPRTTLTLGGLCCVLPDFRRHGLFGALMGRAISAGDMRSPERILTAGRMAHPGAFRLMAVRPSVVPKPGLTPTLWQQQVGQAVADVYGVENFDPETFVCVGSGKPIGYPLMEVEAKEHEWEVFEPVDRDRGDALLGIAWNPDPPDGW